MGLLQVSRQSGLLTIEAADPQGAFWQGQIRLREGNIIACRVYRKADGQILLAGEEARSWLLAQGKLNWSVEEESQFPDTLLPQGGRPEERNTDSGLNERVDTEPVQSSTWIPRRTSKGIVTSAQSLGSFEYLQVFSLVNGQNTAEGITRILRKPPATIARVLESLRAAGLIE
jgi:hypothetical protein